MNKPVIVEVFAEGAIVEFAETGMGAPKAGLAGLALVMGNLAEHKAVAEFQGSFLVGHPNPMAVMMGAVTPEGEIPTKAYRIEAPADVEGNYVLIVGEKEGTYYFSFNTDEFIDTIEDGVMEGAFASVTCPVEHIEAFVADINAIDYTNAPSQA